MKMTTKYPFALTMAMLSSTILGCTYPIMGLNFAYVSIEMLNFQFPLSNSDSNYDKFALHSWLFVVIGLVSAGVQFLTTFFFSVIGQKITRQLREQLYNAMLRKQVSWFDQESHDTGKLNAILSSDTAKLNSVASQSLGMVFQTFASLGLGFILSMAYSWRLGLVMLALSPFILLGGILEAQASAGRSTKIAEAYKQSSALVTQAVTNYKTIMSFANQRRVLEFYSATLSKPYREGVKRAHWSGLMWGISQFSLWIIYGLSFYLAAEFMQKNWLKDPGNMFKAIYCIFLGAFGAGEAQAFAPDIGKAIQSAKSVYNIIDEPSLVDPLDDKGEKIKYRTIGKIEFKNVWFKYPSRNQWVLKGFNLQIEAGQTVALVGQSGSGKSTIIGLLQRFYDIQRGVILLDGKDIKEIHIKSLRDQMALVSQEPLLFNASIADNIAYGKENIEIKEIEAVAEAANASQFIRNGKEGYQRNVGPRGSKLSGGQKQRIAIARALLKNPSILLLDEATSALDKQSEAIVQQALDDVMKSQTSIIIAHRLSTIEHVDMVVVLEEGKLVEKGEYLSLLNNKHGAFHELAVGAY